MAQATNDPMQREAVRRMQEMHSRAARAGGENNAKNDNEHEKEVERRTDTQPKSVGGAPNGPLSLNMQHLLADKDRSLVLIIILLLLGEHSDTSLVMALVYLIL